MGPREGTRTHSGGRHTLRLLEVDELFVLPVRMPRVQLHQQPGSAYPHWGALSLDSRLAHTTPCLVGSPAPRCGRGRCLLRRGSGWRRLSA
eukprot:826625-Pleurochrysis_carterae.AAC.18